MSNLKTIDANIVTIRKSGDAFNQLVHETGLLILAHAKEHGDCTRALTVVKAMPASIRRTILVKWISKYSPIRVVEKNDKVGMLKENDKRFTPFDIEGATAEPWFILADKEPEKDAYDFAAILAMVQRLGKTIEKKIEDNKVKPEDILSAHAVVAALTALKVQPVKAIANDETKEGFTSNLTPNVSKEEAGAEPIEQAA